MIAGLGGRAITKDSLHASSTTCSPTGWSPSPHLPRPGLGGRRAELERSRVRRARARTPRTSCATSGRRRGVALKETMPYQEIKLYQTGTLRGGQPPARSRPALRAGADGALEHAHVGPPGLPGLRRGARRALRARRGDARHRRARDRRQRDRLPRGVLDAVPRVVMAAPLDPLPVRQRAGGGDRDRCRAEGEGPHRRAGRRPGRRRRARSTSASPACRGCSSETTTCCSSATTTRPT